MPYDHVTSLPFLLDSSYLTPEEIVEREANPALFAARRYGQPEHIFRTAGECRLVFTLSVLTIPQPSAMETDRYEAPCHHSQQRIPTLPQLCPSHHKPHQQLQYPQGYVTMDLLKANNPVDLRLQHHISLIVHTRQVRRALVDLQRLAITFPLYFRLLRLNAQPVARHRRRPHIQKRIGRNTLDKKHKAT